MMLASPTTPDLLESSVTADRHTGTTPDDSTPLANVNAVWAREPLPADGPSVFLAGPTPRSSDVPSWRPAAIAMLESTWHSPSPLTVFTPESRGGKRAIEYHDQVEWEHRALDTARVIMFWIPRDIRTLPGFTTNVEYGVWAASGKVVLGCPPGCPNPERNRYLIWHARHLGVPVAETLPETVNTALHMLTRHDG
jgi:hypothetical protein